MTDSKSRLFPLPVQILLGMAIGIAIGLFLGPRAETFGILGRIIIDLIKALAVPLVFFAIIEAIVSTHIPAKTVRKLFAVVSINAMCACAIALSLANYFQPGVHLRELISQTQTEAPVLPPAAEKKLDVVEVLSSHVPKNILQPFLENDILMVVLLAVLIGLAARSESLKSEVQIERGVRVCLKICERLLLWLVQLVPLAVLGVCAKTVGQYGFKPFEALVAYVGVCLLGLSLQCACVYQAWIAFVAKRSLKKFWSAAIDPIVYALGTNSSLATLPLTLSALDSLNVKRSCSRLGACVGTNFNNDGILLYEAMAALFVAQAYGMDLSLLQQIGICGLCILTAIGVAGVPEAGVISLSLVLTATHMPTDLLPVFLTVDWIVARARSVTNVLSDMTVSIALDAPGLTEQKEPAA